ncbi:metal-dependent transcriptional regulator [Murdochiella vaginalis]|uniref:metal-dependent transcriptional regulator n=1 Tax=Murdochiella vaginalis TaxID=1852373 RepID=UPI0008FE4C80|nr:metal-dependent transcriptional regulator [Murdochiella vaginalis]
MHNIHDSEENYLEAIVVLERDLGVVRSIDVANHLELSRASVSNAMKKLEQEGRVTMEDDGSLQLSSSGRAIGEEIDLRHRTLRDWFLHVGVSPEVAEEDACKVEHAISAETFDCLRAYFDQNIRRSEK